MRIVQTFWSGNNKDIISNKFGWLSEEYHLMSWALSCLQLNKFYDEVVLYTDQLGYDLLIKKLKLPYSKVYVELDKLNMYQKDLWGLAKIYSYSKQSKPFLHVDGDVFIWEAFSDNIINQPLIAQNLEFGSENCYEPMLTELEKNLNYFPPEVLSIRKEEKKIWSFNAGVFGGSDIEFFKEYTIKAFCFVDNNKADLGKINRLTFNLFFEQYLFYCLSKRQGKSVTVLFNEVIQDNEYKYLGDFENVPHNKKYLHLLGTFKKDYKTCELMLRRLREDYPEFYYRILNFFPDKYKYTITTEKYNSTIDIRKDFEFLQKSQRDIFLKFDDYIRRTFVYLKYLGSSLLKDNVSKKQIENEITQFKNSFLEDVFFLERKIWEFVCSSNQNLSVELLFKRDVNINKYYNKDLLRNNYALSRNDNVKIIESKWSWNSSFDFESIIDINQSTEIEEIKTVLIPEIESPFYSEMQIDGLDEIILEILTKPTTTLALINEIKKYFIENTDENFSDEELQYLVCSRLKKMIFSKCLEIS